MNSHWKLNKLGDLLGPISRTTIVQPLVKYDLLGIRLDGKGPFLRESNEGSSISASTLNMVAAGDFIYSRLFAWRGAFGVIGEELDGCNVSNEFPTFRPDRDKLDINFLRLWFRLPETLKRVETDCTGSTPLTRNRYKERFFLNLEIPLPPLAEQRRIVAKIEALAAKIEDAQGLRKNSALKGELAVLSAARNMLSRIDAEVTTVRDWIDTSREGIKTGPFGAQLGRGDFRDNGVPILTIGNVQYNGLLIDRLSHVSEEKASDLSPYKVREGDILFARMGTVGRCCVVPKEADGWLFNYHIIRLALDQSRIEPRFLHWTIRASAGVSDYLSETIRGATRAGVNSKIVGSLPCRVPPIAEQRRIVTYLDGLQAQVDALKKLQTQTTAELDALLPAILDRAFKGEL